MTEFYNAAVKWKLIISLVDACLSLFHVLRIFELAVKVVIVLLFMFGVLVCVVSREISAFIHDQGAGHQPK